MYVLEMVPDGERIKRRRQELGMSQEDLSKRSGVIQPQLSRLEQGRYPNTMFRTLNKIAQALEYPPEQLLYSPLPSEGGDSEWDLLGYNRAYQRMSRKNRLYLCELLRLVILHEIRQTAIDKSLVGWYNAKASLADERLTDAEVEASELTETNKLAQTDDAMKCPPKKRGESATA